jgi:serine/threonine protein kinase
VAKVAQRTDDPLIGRPLPGGYVILDLVGIGGMGRVYRAEQTNLGRTVAVKIIHPHLVGEENAAARFIQEYTLVSRIADPHVVRIHDQGFTDDHAYIAMEYFERGDLRAELKAGMPRERVLEVVRQIARGLGVIHAHGIIHRDLKPENVMLRADGSVAIADFGVAKSMLKEDYLALTQTRHGEVVGTPYYLSPEQASGREIGPASDVYSLGVMMYEMLAGQRPFSAETLDLLLARHLTAPVPALPPQHADLQPLLERMMAKRAEDRPASAQALLQALDALQG